MKLREFQSVADEQLDKGRQIRSELEENRRTLEDMESEREARYDDMAAAMEVDEDFRPMGDIITANDLFEQAKDARAAADESVRASEEALYENNEEKFETIRGLEEFVEEVQESRDRLQGASDNKFADALEPLDDKFAEKSEEAQMLRDELLASMEEGTGELGRGDSLGASGSEGISDAGHMESVTDSVPEPGDNTTDAGNEGLSDEDRAYREMIMKQRSEAFRQKVMNDPMTKNPLFSGVRQPKGAGGPCLTFGIDDENLGKLSYAQGHNEQGWVNDCAMAQISNLLILSGRNISEAQVVNYIDSVRSRLRCDAVHSADAKVNGTMISSDMQKVLAHYGIETDLYETRTSLGSTIRQMFGRSSNLDPEQLADALESGKGVMLGVSINLLYENYMGNAVADHEIQMVGTARDLRTHELVGFYINDTSHVDKHKDGRLERTQTVFVPRWRLEQALNVPGGDAIVTRNRIR